MLRPDGLAPARHRRFAKVAPGVPFASPARESRRALLDCRRANPPDHDIQRLRRAGDGGGKLAAARLAGGNWFAGIAGKSRERAAFAPLPRRWLAPVRNCPHARGSCKDARHLAAKLRALRFAGMESRQAASRWRDCAGGIVPRKFNLALRTAGMKEQPTLRFSLRCEAGRRLCFRDSTQHTLSVWSGKNLPHKFFSCRQLPARGNPSARNLCQTMWRCVQSRCGVVTVTAPRRPPAARGRPPRGSHRANLQASCPASRPRRRFES